MNGSLISIIVPVYNSAEYVERCIRSIMNQTYDNLEILIIDDGSTDKSGEICDCLAEEDTRITVFHQDNGGASLARNVGLSHASGEYIGFVDSDDYIDIDMYESLIKEFFEPIDFVMCGRYIEYPQTAHRRNVYAYVGRGVKAYIGDDAILEFLRQKKSSMSVCEKLFKRSVFDTVRFPEGKTSEDMEVIFTVLKTCRGMVHIGAPKYHNFCRPNSTSRKEFNVHQMDQFYCARGIRNYIIENKPLFKKEAEIFYQRIVLDLINHIENGNKEEQFKETYEMLRSELGSTAYFCFDNPDYYKDELDKFREYYDIQVRWIDIKARNKGIGLYFKKYNYRSVAIYGMRELGEALITELEDSRIKVIYGVDQNAEYLYSKIDLYKPDESLPKADVIVVTSIHYYSEIEEKMKKVTRIPIISLSDVLFDECFN